MLKVENLSVKVEDKQVLHNLSLELPKGQVHAIMGPNGSGKSTLSHVIAGREGYEVVSGRVLLDGKDILNLAPEDRATMGLFLAFQYPVEIPGVSTVTFLKTALNALRTARGEPELDALQFMKLMRAKAAPLGMDDAMLRRAVNTGFSGGEKKRAEALQLALLEPRIAILDETDSGLDIDSLKIVAESVNRQRAPDRSLLVITHYQRLLDYIKPDRVHVLLKGEIRDSGGPELALALEREGYARYGAEAA